MFRLVFWFAVLVAVTFGVTWLADSPGSISVVVRGYRIETQSIGLAVLALGLLFVAIWLAWGIFKWIIGRPGAFGGFFARRRQRKGRAALASGLVAIGAGDNETARKAAIAAGRLLPDDPLAQLLMAQSALQQGDTARVRQVYADMSKTDDTKLLGLRGLFNEARREKNIDAARDIAKQALAEHPGVSWASNAMLVSHAAAKDWPAVLQLLDNQQKTKIITREDFLAKKAVVLTAQALEAEESNPGLALDLATAAHKLDSALVPAAVVAGRTNAALGSLRKATRILEKTWKTTPHPDIAEVYAHARAGDSPSDRLARIKTLIGVSKGGEEGALALASAAIEASDWALARKTLEPLIKDQPSVRACSLMAEIETGEFGDKGRTREWLARAVHARRDPAWTADGYVGPDWLPVSPVTGELGKFEWKLPVEGLGYSESRQSEQIRRLLEAATPDSDETQRAQEAKVVDVEVVEPEPESPEASHAAAADANAEMKTKTDTDADTAADEKIEVPEKQKSATNTTAAEKPAPASPAPVKHKDTIDTPTHRLPDDPGPRKKGDPKQGESWFG